MNESEITSTAQGQAKIRFENVHKSFGTKHVLRGLSLEVQKGEVFFVLGCSGTGKSVMLKHMVGLLIPDSGNIWIDNDDVAQFSEEQFGPIREKCGLVFQLPALVDSRNLYENLVLGVRHMDSQQQAVLIKQGLHAVGLDHLKSGLFDRYPPSLSYGEQKRLALARTLIPDPEILLYDEPTTGLDPKNAVLIHDLIRDISDKQHKTSIVVSHDMRNALNTADRLAVVDKGEVIDLGTPEEILASNVPLTRSFLEDLRE